MPRVEPSSRRTGTGRNHAVALAAILSGAGLLLGACQTDTPDPARPDRDGLLVLSVPDEETAVIRERDTSVEPGQLYSFVSKHLCLTRPGVATLTGAEFDPASTGLEIVDVRARPPEYGGYGSHLGRLDSKHMGFTADDYTVDRVCQEDGGSADPAWEETGITVRRTSESPGRASRIRYLYEFDGEAHTTGWFRSHWTIGR